MDAQPLTRTWWTSKRRPAAALLVVVWWPMAAVGPASGQEIIGACGTPIGELEPWGNAGARATADAGMARRLVDIMRQPIERLDATEARVHTLAQAGERTAVVDELSRRQAEVGVDLLTLIGTLKKHRNEILEWKLGAQAEAVGGVQEGFGGQLLAAALGETTASNSAGHGAARWKWCAAAWLPVGCGLRLNPGEERTLRQLGVEATSHVGDPDWAWLAFLEMLRQTAVGADGGVQPAGALGSLLSGEIPRLVSACGLGQPASAEEFDRHAERLLGRRAVAGVFRRELQDRWDLEGGEFVYSSLRQEAEAPVRAALDGALLPGVLKGSFVLAGATAQEVADGYADRKAHFTALEAECIRSCGQAATVERAGIERLYQPYLTLLASFPPCLSPYRADQVQKDWLRFVEDEAAAVAEGSGSSPAEAASRPVVSAMLCLLQADCWNEDGVWRWAPRAAGARAHLDRFLNAAAAAAGKESVR